MNHRTEPPNHRTKPTALVATFVLFLAGCGSPSVPQAPDLGQTPQPEVSESASTADGHGAITGVAEMAEPQLHLVAIDAEGETSMVDLLNGTQSRLGRVESPVDVSTDGRYVFAVGNTGVEIVDSGAWTWDHVDHFHYYRADPRNIGKVDGEGAATIATGMLSTAGTTGMFFPTSGEAVLLENASLSGGTISETLRIKTKPHAGLMAPLGEGAVVTESDDDGNAVRLRAIDGKGKELSSTECRSAAGAITTRVGLVIGCSDGAVIATTEGTTAVFERVPYPAGAAAPATEFNGRKGRPTVAGLSPDSGAWLLNTRQRTWEWLPTATPVIAAATADDAGHHVVVIGTDGTVQVYDASTRKLIAGTKPLVAASLAEPVYADKIRLTVDAQRAYVNAPAEGLVYEIDYADDARIARTLELPTKPVHVVETGR
ncbi:ABC transporter [Arthrobacter sp. ISL-95]|uniref:ABC transporter n=1 Tax=Arthrobacter sp. ISL-95 TaxID=2819116 RepID=UPI001BEBD674|nr:ABC transporter [Arthrobacter sp. ISL-95]MBT2586379.1 ABC transporter [Arthrobacter sp. ISL-95]